MEEYAQLVSLVSTLLAMPHWDPESVSRALGSRLAPIEARTAKLRCYAADAAGPSTRFELDHPVYGGRTGWTIDITPVRVPPADPLVVLAPVLTKEAQMKLSGPPTPGSAGPTVFRHTRAMSRDGRELIFSFEGPNLQGPQVLTGITLRRPHPMFAPDVYALQRFRAVSMQQAPGFAFAIEHKEGERSALRVQELKQEGHTLRITYVIDDPFLDEQLAHELIRYTLLDEHLEQRFHGKVDRLVFVNAALGTAVEAQEKL
jgi:hypothetical protein